MWDYWSGPLSFILDDIWIRLYIITWLLQALWTWALCELDVSNMTTALSAELMQRESFCLVPVRSAFKHRMLGAEGWPKTNRLTLIWIRPCVFLWAYKAVIYMGRFWGNVVQHLFPYLLPTTGDVAHWLTKYFTESQYWEYSESPCKCLQAAVSSQ